MYPTVRQFYILGFQREWKPAGSHLFKAGLPATHLYVVVSGRLRSMGTNGAVSFEVIPL